MDRCQRPGCRGEIEDGFCKDCGLAPVGISRLGTMSVGPRSQSVHSASLPSSVPLSGRTGSVGRSTSRGAGRALGAGFVSLPVLPSQDPLQKILADATVPERKRFCGSCRKKVSRESGFCPFCGKAYSFVPTLKAGDTVAGQYEVKGPIAFGGFGWIYLAQDTRLKQRWVVLKGMLNTKDEATAAAALQEREFLSAVKHPNIVSVYNFAMHGAEGFIVMEYVGGKTLAELRKERGPLPPVEAIAYIHRVLSAFAYLHEQGLVYCDFKPPNAMLEDDVKLIDMGGVRRISETEGEVYGTKGFFAPEIGDSKGPSFVSDLYTVARSLAVLMFDFEFQDKYQYTLPSPHKEPVLATHDSLHRFLVKATHPEPNRRFQSAGEMASQLLGVLRDAASTDGAPRVVESAYFGGDAMDIDSDIGSTLRPVVLPLPPLKVDTEDPAANAILSFPAADPKKRAQHFEKLATAMPQSMELRLRLADAFIAVATSGGIMAAPAFERASKSLEAAHTFYPYDWRVDWQRGRLLLAQGQKKEAFEIFDRVYSEIPGELCAKLGYAVAAEALGNLPIAARFYDLVSRCDPSYSTACFGLARCLTQQGNRAGAAAAYARVPQNSSHYVKAQIALVRTLIDFEKAPPTETELSLASDTVKALPATGFAVHELRAQLFLASAKCLEAGGIVPRPSVTILDVPCRHHDLKLAAEKELRACARMAATSEERMGFVDKANRERPFTLV